MRSDRWMVRGSLALLGTVLATGLFVRPRGEAISQGPQRDGIPSAAPVAGFLPSGSLPAIEGPGLPASSADALPPRPVAAGTASDDQGKKAPQPPAWLAGLGRRFPGAAYRLAQSKAQAEAEDVVPADAKPEERMALEAMKARWTGAPPVTPAYSADYREGLVVEHQGVRVRQRLLGARESVLALQEGGASYAGVLPGVDALMVAQPGLVEEFLHLPAKAAKEVAYDLTIETEGCAFREGPRLEVLDAKGKPVLRLDEITYWCAAEAGSEHKAQASLALTGERSARLSIAVPAEHRGAEVLLDPTWASTQVPALQRVGHTATLLCNGKVLVVGGDVTSSCELYDPRSEMWCFTGSLITARTLHKAALLSNGKVLVMGGGSNSTGYPMITTCELYDPETGTWSATASPQYLYSPYVSLTALPTGKALAIGGQYIVGNNSYGATVGELFDPSALGGRGEWRPTASHGGVIWASMTMLLEDGKVLIVGGSTGPPQYRGMCRLFDSSTEAWEVVQSLPSQLTSFVWNRRDLCARLSDGRVMVIGCQTPGGQRYWGVFDPTTKTWGAVASPLRASAIGPTNLTTLPNGQVLMTTYDGGCQLYDPLLGSWFDTAPMFHKYCVDCTTTLLPDGRVLAVGRDTWGKVSELFELVGSATPWNSTGAMHVARANHTASLLHDGRVLVTGGRDGRTITVGRETLGAGLASCELYDPAIGGWRPTADLLEPRIQHAATVLSDGRVLVTGGGTAWQGYYYNSTLSSCELYDPTTGLWAAAAPMSVPRRNHAATLLSNGQVLVIGGQSKDRFDNYLTSCELYDPLTNTWQVTSRLVVPSCYYHQGFRLPDGRVFHTIGSASELYDPIAREWRATISGIGGEGLRLCAVMLRDGRVLQNGKEDNFNTWRQVYDPVRNVWQQTPSTWGRRIAQTMSLLPDGNVLVVEGGDLVRSCTLFNPTANKWGLIPGLLEGRSNNSATLLNNGKILVAGGLGRNGDFYFGYHRSCELYDGGLVVPSVPTSPRGPAVVVVGHDTVFNASSGNLGEELTYNFEWGDGTFSSVTGIGNVEARHSWSRARARNLVRVRTESAQHGTISNWSPPLSIYVNTPPSAPAGIQGPEEAPIASPAAFSASATDPDGDPVALTFDWGDGTTSTTAPTGSGVPVSVQKQWARPGAYTVRAYATDAWGTPSEAWSAPFTVAVYIPAVVEAKFNGQNLHTSITLAQGYSFRDIDPRSVTANGVSPYNAHPNGHEFDAFFRADAVQDLGNGTGVSVIRGRLRDGSPFRGEVTVALPRKKPAPHPRPPPGRNPEDEDAPVLMRR